ncbi:TetR family transcriptional regulator [Microbulbifer sp. OS29]|uniref:TetR family transcriptional regulator n=1 Tax=Microbulbifer okhotskensis TaxID=2926617 RepID=A0A9X2J4X5_9GAMM|nr:TetR family transcriptional regulator [Microbulbifer okhotskensis]MCO1334992.1 TetR family transcriptional regulator [Microbulbifer okhotskensis]
MTKRRKEQTLTTRERILNAAINVFHEFGVCRPSLSEVAKLAGVSHGAVTDHFQSKDGLLKALTERMPLPGERLCDSAGDELKANPLGTLRTRWVWLFHEIACNPEWQQVLEIIFHPCEPLSESGDMLQRMKLGRTQGLERMGQLISLAVSERQLPEDLDIDLAMQMLHGGLFGILEDWLLSSKLEDIGELGERYIDSLIDMIRFSPTMRLNRSQLRVLH